MDDLRQALRSLRKQPGFAVVATLTLAFGIAVNVSLFGMISAFFLRPLAVKDPGNLVLVLQLSDIISIPYGHSYPDFLDFRSGSNAFSDMVAFTPQPAHISARGQTPERTWIEVVSPNYFVLAGVSPALGDFPVPDNLSAKAPPTIVLSHAYWQRRFGGNPSIVGQPIALNGHAFVVSGIAPANFTGLSWAMAVSGWVPAGAMGMLADGGDAMRENRGAPAWRLMGRLAPAKTIDDARSQIEVIAKRLAAEYPVEHKGSRVFVLAESRSRPDPAISTFLPIFAAVFSLMVGFVLLIACANVANLMFSRALVRQRDLVIRSALGASRFRLVRLQLVETVVLASIAGMLGFVLAQWSGQLLAGLIPSGDIPTNPHHETDWRLYAFTVVISVLTGVMAGLWPARKATSFNMAESLKEGSAAAGTSRHWLRNALVIGQVTMSVVVLASAGLFFDSLRRMQKTQLGFKPDGLLMASIDLGLQQYDDARGRRFLDDLLQRAKALPGVTSATAATHVPFDYGMRFAEVTIVGGIPGSKDEYASTPYNIVEPGFFETSGAPITRGRAFDTRDGDRSRRVAVINETMARKFWPGQDPLGRRFRLGRDGDWIDVVGVAADGKYVMLAEQTRPYFFVPLAQDYRSPITIILRSAGDPSALAGPLQKLLNGMDPDLPVYNVRTMDNHLRTSVFALLPLRVGTSMAGVQGVIALLLAVMGLYAVVSYAVARRTREIGVRMALGAARLDVVRLVVREGMWLSVIGIVIGLGIALVLGLVLSSVLYGVAAIDAPVFGGATALLLAVSALACYLPARRATRVDPLIALRYE
jgi:predicted permease